MKTLLVTDKIKKDVKEWRKTDKRKNPDVFIHFLSRKEKPFQGWVWLSSPKNVKEVKLGNFHSAGDLLTMLEAVLREYPLCRGRI
jgi:hypothetical protein